MDGIDLMLSNACVRANKTWKITRFLMPRRYDNVVENLTIAIEMGLIALQEKLSTFRREQLQQRLEYACNLYKDLNVKNNTNSITIADSKQSNDRFS